MRAPQQWAGRACSKREFGSSYFGGIFKMIHPPKEKAHGHLGAYDPVTGKQHWVYNSKYPILASVLATAGDVPAQIAQERAMRGPLEVEMEGGVFGRARTER